MVSQSWNGGHIQLWDMSMGIVVTKVKMAVYF